MPRISYSEINVELQDHCTCLIYGHEAAILTSHLAGSHQLTPKEYRVEFPGTELMAETIGAARMRAKSPIPH
jgi:predicted transcriptional regulator